MPTDGHDPPGTSRPREARREYMSISWTAGPSVALPFETRIEFRRLRSTTTPVDVVE
jgi:hypothetical protein